MVFQINMSDRFAEVMKSNMGSRRCTLYTDDCSTAQAQRDRSVDLITTANSFEHSKQYLNT